MQMVREFLKTPERVIKRTSLGASKLYY